MTEKKHWTQQNTDTEREQAYIDYHYASLNDQFYKEHPEDYPEEIFEDPKFWDFCHEQYIKAINKLEEVYE